MKYAFIAIYLAVLAVFLFGWGATIYHLYRYGFDQYRHNIHRINFFFGVISVALIIWATYLLFQLI